MDAGGGGDFTTIQEAVDHLPNPGPCTVIVKAGTYHESVTIEGKNSLAVSESQRIVIQSEAPGAAIVDPSTLIGSRVGVISAEAQSAHAFTISSTSGLGGAISGFLTVKGFTMTGATSDAVNIFSADGTTIAGRDLTIDGNNIHDNGGATGSGIEIGINNPRLWIVNNLVRGNTRHGIHWPSSPSTATTYVVNNTIIQNGWSGLTRPGSTSAVLLNNLVIGNGTVSADTENCKCGLGEASAGTPASITLKNNLFIGNGPGNTPGSGLQNVNDIASPDDVLDGGDSGNFTTTGHANNTSSTTAGIAGCAFSDCAPTHLVTEIFVGPSDFHLTVPGSPAIDKGLSGFLDLGREWEPSVDFDGDVRPQGPALDIGFDEALLPITPTSTPVPSSTPTPGQVTTTPTGVAVQNIPTLSGSFFLALGLLLAALGYLLTRNGIAVRLEDGPGPGGGSSSKVSRPAFWARDAGAVWARAVKTELT